MPKHQGLRPVRRHRLGIGATIVVLAFAISTVGAGALAAGHYLITSTKQIKPSVLHHLEGARGAAGVGIGGIFGSGADGSRTIKADTTLSHDVYYRNLTVNSGVTLDTGGYRVFVAGTLTLRTGAQISRNGADASSSSPAAGVTSGTLGNSAPGASHGLCAGGTATNSLGGVGGNAGSSMVCPGGPVMRPAAEVGGAQVFDAALQAISGRTLDGVIVNGGAGGGGGTSSSDNGGAGGGVVVVVARSVVVKGHAVISAAGGNGSGDGGGGGGGVVVVVSTSPRPAGVTISAAGGSSALHKGSAGFSAWLS